MGSSMQERMQERIGLLPNPIFGGEAMSWMM